MPRYLRTVLRVGEAVGFGELLRAFVEKGIALEAEHPAAARAFFALESRGALAFLRQHDVAVVLEHVEQTLRGYLQLIAPGRPAIDGVDANGLFPVVTPDAVTIPLGRRTDVFPSWEENFTLLKLQATLATLWTSEGTRDFALGAWLETDDRGGLPELFARFVAPEVAAGMFTHLEAVRLMPVLKRRYPGLAADLGELRERVFPGDRPRAAARRRAGDPLSRARRRAGAARVGRRLARAAGRVRRRRRRATTRPCTTPRTSPRRSATASPRAI